MKETIASQKNFPHLISVYLVPAWPNVHPFGNRHVRSVRQRWVPIFEDNGIRLAFEYHDHAYKRTVPIFDGKEDREKGIVYMVGRPHTQSRFS